MTAEQTVRLTFLGSGTGVPSVERASPGMFLELPEARMLIDLGPGTLRQLARLSVPITEIDYILITHLHPDHSLDLAAFLFASNYPPYLRSRKPVRVLAGREFEAFFKKLKALYGHWIELPPGLLTTTTLPQDRTWEGRFPSFILESGPVFHTSSSLGYRITLPDGKTLVFSGDSDYASSLVHLARRADLLVLECSFPEEEKVAGHLTPSQAGRIASQAGVKQLFLTHFYPECRGKDLIGPCSREFSGPITLAEDFLSVEV